MTSIRILLPSSFTVLAALLSVAAAPTLTPDQMLPDFDLMLHALEEGHPGLYRYTPRQAMDANFEEGRSKLTHLLSRPQFEAIIARTLATIHCGHTKLEPDQDVETAFKKARTFPLRILTEGRHLMVLFNDTADDRTIVPGMEVTEIDGRRTDDLIDRMAPFISGDGDIETGRLHDISAHFAQLYWQLIGQPDSFTIKARDEAGSIVTATLAGVTDSERRQNQNRVNAAMKARIAHLIGWSPDNVAFRFLKEPEIAEIRLRSFTGGNFAHDVEQTFKTLHERGAKTLIIDLRGNGGGNDMYGAVLVSYLTDTPFRYFDRIHLKTIDPSFKSHCDWIASAEDRLRDGTIADPAGGYLVTAKLHPGVAEQAPGRYPFLGKVFILTDGGTFSTAADFCAIVHALHRATFIGEETGGAYCGNNSGLMPSLTLPNTRVSIRLPMYEYWNAVGTPADTRHGTVPDLELRMKAADMLRGNDTQLDLAVKLANSAGQVR